MKTPPATPPVSHPDWLNDCSFQSRQESLGLMPGILGHHVKKSTHPVSFHRNFSSAGGVTVAEHGLVPVTNQDFGLVVEEPDMSKLPKSKNDEVLSELRNLRQLSASVFDPKASREFLPDMILFGVIGVLCAAWPILSMLGAMAGRH
jgi:hypothetical protein